MKERPILFSGAMVKALLAGTKTQTRRILKSPHIEDLGAFAFDAAKGLWEGGIYGDGGALAHGEWVKCPYGVVGDRLWVRETHSFLDGDFIPTKNIARARTDGHVTYQADHAVDPKHGDGPHKITWRPSIFLPRWASRITLEVTDVRVQLLQSISEEDARAEGVKTGEMLPAMINGERGQVMIFNPIKAYAVLWDSINGKTAPWASNPFVWVVSFLMIEGPANAKRSA